MRDVKFARFEILRGSSLVELFLNSLLLVKLYLHLYILTHWLFSLKKMRFLTHWESRDQARRQFTVRSRNGKRRRALDSYPEQLRLTMWNSLMEKGKIFKLNMLP